MIELTVVDAASEPAQWALQQYFNELAARFPNGFDPGDALAEAGVQLNPPHGVFVLAVQNTQPVACGAVQYLDVQTAEIKRMWVSPACRGAGLGKRMLVRLEDESRAAGRSRVVLDTNGTLTQAIAMYHASGYVDIERYNDNPYAERWFEKALT